MSRFFIRRPIVAMVIAILTVIAGAVTIAGLPIALFPQIAPPEVQVSAVYTGADAQTIEQSVATPIEQQMSGVDNMNYMYSLNATAKGEMRMIVDFDVSTDPNTDLILSQMRSTLAASSVFLLYEAAHGLTREMGQNFSTMRTSDDPEARNFVDLVIDRLRHPPSSEGAMKEPVT